MFDTFKNRLELSGTLTTVTALRIGQGRSSEPTGSDLPVVKDAFGRPLIPGSSFKGALRSRLESFVRGVDIRLAKDPSELVNKDIQQEVTRLKKELKNDDHALTQALDKLADAVSRPFGTPWKASKFQVRDLAVKPETWFDQYQERDGVSIERDTETAVDGRLYDFQVVPAGVEFEFRAIFENAEQATIKNQTTGEDEKTDYWELGLLAVGLEQFAQQKIPLGGGNSVGLGVVELAIEDIWWVDPADTDEMLKYIKRLSVGNQEDYKITPETFAAHKEDWVNALITYLGYEAHRANVPEPAEAR